MLPLVKVLVSLKINKEHGKVIKVLQIHCKPENCGLLTVMYMKVSLITGCLMDKESFL